MSIFSVIRFADEEQQTSYFKAIREGDYDIFYRLLGEEPSEEIQRNITTLKNEGLFLPLSLAGGGAKAFSRRKRTRIQNRRRRNKTIKL
jgi:coproporphyrinogen III oxidase-like Fe-S oxidoreductase